MFDIDYDSVLGCYCLHYRGEVICLGSQTLGDAEHEAETIINTWQ